MKYKSLFISALIIMSLGTLKAEENWSTDYAAAKTLATKTGKSILLDFTGSDWCMYCKKLEDEVFATPQFHDFSKDYILVRLDYPRTIKLTDAEHKQNDQLKSLFLIEGYPTVIVLDSKGVELKRQVGYEPGSGPVAFLSGLVETSATKIK